MLRQKWKARSDAQCRLCVRERPGVERIVLCSVRRGLVASPRLSTCRMRKSSAEDVRAFYFGRRLGYNGLELTEYGIWGWSCDQDFPTDEERVWCPNSVPFGDPGTGYVERHPLPQTYTRGIDLATKERHGLIKPPLWEKLPSLPSAKSQLTETPCTLWDLTRPNLFSAHHCSGSFSRLRTHVARTPDVIKAQSNGRVPLGCH